jgi:ribosomal protein L28
MAHGNDDIRQNDCKHVRAKRKGKVTLQRKQSYVNTLKSPTKMAVSACTGSNLSNQALEVNPLLTRCHRADDIRALYRSNHRQCGWTY